MTRWLPALLVALLALPFDAFWPDFERARRGLLLLVAAGLAVPAMRQRIDPTGLPLLLLALWYGLRGIGAGDTLGAADRTLHLLALWLSFQFASRYDLLEFARGAAIAAGVASVYTLLQAIGLEWPYGYATAKDPVATFGNRNYAAEFLAVAGALLGYAAARGARPALPLSVLGLTAAALVVNGSRSGLALGLALLLVLAARGMDLRRRLLVGGVALLGVGVGWLWPAAAAELPPAPLLASEQDPADGMQLAEQAPSTLAVRAEIWRSAAAIVADHPLLGIGAGQFARTYPLYRSPQEIELSSFGQRFWARPESAHQDLLEVAVETGLLGAVLLLAFAIAAVVQRQREGGLAAIAPLAAFLLVSLVRSPLGNAPAAFLAFACAGAGPLRPAPSRIGLRTAVGALLALPLAATGTLLLAAQCTTARLVEDLRFPAPGFDRIAAADRALSWTWGDPRLHLLRLQLLRRASQRQLAAEPARNAEISREFGARAQPSVEALGLLDPNGTLALLQRARFALDQGDLQTAQARLLFARQLDPQNPELALALARVHLQLRQPALALGVLYDDPHPRLAAELPGIVSSLAAIAREQQDEQAAQLLDLEASMLMAAERLRQDPRSPQTKQAIAATGALFRVAGVRDLRGPILVAVQLLAHDLPDEANAAGRAAQAAGLTLSAHDRALYADLIAKLAGLEGWAWLAR